MSFRRSIRKAPEKRVHLPRDNTKLKVLNYLASKKEGSTRNELNRKSNISVQSDDNFKIILDEMIEMNWITKKSVAYGGGMTIYEIAEEGRKALEQAKVLLNTKHPLSKLSAFNELD